MSWPHDPDGPEGSEAGRKYGLAIIAKKLESDDFPLTKRAAIEAFGEDPVRLDDRDVVAASDLLDSMPDDEYESKVAFLRAAGTAMRTGGFWTFEEERYVS